MKRRFCDSPRCGLLWRFVAALAALSFGSASEAAPLQVNHPGDLTLLLMQPVVTISAPDPVASEAGPSSGLAVVSRTGSTKEALTVFYHVEGSAMSGLDFQALPGQVTIPAGSSRGTIVVRPVDDPMAETNETVKLILTVSVPVPPPGGGITLAYQIGEHAAATVTIMDDDLGFTRVPTVSLTVSDDKASEQGRKTATFLVTRLGPANEALRVEYGPVEFGRLPHGMEPPMHQPPGNDITRYPAALNGVDYELLSGSVTIPAGSAKAVIVVRPIDDAIFEGPERVSLRLKENKAYHLNPPYQQSIVIADNDPTNRPPSVHITQPQSGASFAGPALISIRAEASDPGGKIERLDIFAGDKLLGSARTSPLAVTWTNVPAGAYTLTARAKDNAGAIATSAPVRITVTGGGEGLNAKINFQPAGSTVPAGYRADSGKVYGPREAGLSYGWNKDNQENTRDRNSQLSPDQRYDTFAYLQRVPKLVWELGVPKGTYQVRVVAGDPSSFASVYGLNVEGVQAIKGTPSSRNRWLEGNVTVTVQDGRLTIGNRAEAQNNKICFIEVKGEGVTTNRPPAVSMAVPADGATFTAPANILLAAHASDTDGMVKTVEFFQGTTRLGLRTNYPPGSMRLDNPFYLEWANVLPGSYTLTAKATDDRGLTATSPPVRITVVEPVRQAEVNVIAADVEASEAGANGALNTATFRILRSGSTNFALPVFLAISGTASNGVDYTRISNSLVIPKGASSAEIKIRPIDDLLAEGNETIIVTIVPPACIEISPPPPECYLVGPTNRATAHIVDNDVKTNLLPKVEIVKPTNNASFKAPAQIALEAVSRDPDGYAPKVEFFAGTNKIGQSVITFIQAPPPNQPLTHAFLWTNVAAGEYTLTAKATDDQGASGISAPVHIVVQSSVSRITITSPTNDASFSSPANITINATAIDPHGYISRVEFYAGTNKIGVSELVFFRAPDPGEPIHHTFLWKNVPPGTYVVTVKAKDTLGRAVVSEPVRITVHGPRLGGLSAVKALNPDGVELTFSAEAGRTYRVEATTDFLSWTELTTLTPAGNTFQFTDRSAAGQPRRFYRAVLAE